MNTLQMVMEFHVAFGCDISDVPCVPSERSSLVRMQLLTEETAESIHELLSGDVAKLAHELSDLQYVIDGAYITYGLWSLGKPPPPEPRDDGVPCMPHERCSLIFIREFTKHLGLLSGLALADVNQEPPEQVYRETKRVLDTLQRELWHLYRYANLLRARIPVFREIHRANMSKLGPDGRPIINDSGRVVKGPDFKPADAASVLREIYK